MKKEFDPEQESRRLLFGSRFKSFDFFHRYSNWNEGKVDLTDEGMYKVLKQLAGGSSSSKSKGKHGGVEQMMGDIIAFLERTEAVKELYEQNQPPRSEKAGEWDEGNNREGSGQFSAGHGEVDRIVKVQDRVKEAMKKVSNGELETRGDVIDFVEELKGVSEYTDILKEIFEEVEMFDFEGNRVKSTREDLLELVGGYFAKDLERLIEVKIPTLFLEPEPVISRMDPKRTYVNAVLRERNTNPESFRLEDIDSYREEKSANFWVLVDFSGSMNGSIPLGEGYGSVSGLNKLDVAKSVCLGLRHYFRKKEEEGKGKYEVVIAPITGSGDLFTKDSNIDDFVTMNCGGNTPTGPTLKRVLDYYRNGYDKERESEDVLLIISDGAPNITSPDFDYESFKPGLGLGEGVSLDSSRGEVRYRLLSAWRDLNMKVGYIQIESRRDELSGEDEFSPTDVMCAGICDVMTIYDDELLSNLSDFVVEGLR